MIAHMQQTILLLAVLALAAFVMVMSFLERRRQTRFLQTCLTYLKSSSAYEAEDALDRQEQRDASAAKRVISRRLAHDREKEQDFVGLGEGGDMASEILAEMKDHYNKPE